MLSWSLTVSKSLWGGVGEAWFFCVEAGSSWDICAESAGIWGHLLQGIMDNENSTYLQVPRLIFFSAVYAHINCIYISTFIHGFYRSVNPWDSKDLCSRCVNALALFSTGDMSLARNVPVTPQVTRISSPSHLILFTEVLSAICILVQFQRDFQLGSGDCHISLHTWQLAPSHYPSLVGIRWLVSRCEPSQRIHLFKIPGRPAFAAEARQPLPAMYSSFPRPCQEEKSIVFHIWSHAY